MAHQQERQSSPNQEGSAAGAGPSQTTVLEELRDLRSQLEETSRQRDDYFGTLQRLQADFANYRRRMEEEKEETRRLASAGLILRLLSIVDDWGSATRAVPQEAAGTLWVKGIDLIWKKLYAVLEEEGLARIEALGKPFDPWEHEAVAWQESADHGEGTVLGILKEGYKLHGRVVRPAQVIIARAAPQPEPSPDTTPRRETPGATPQKEV